MFVFFVENVCIVVDDMRENEIEYNLIDFIGFLGSFFEFQSLIL